MNTPTEAALKLAVKLSGHNNCQRIMLDGGQPVNCVDCMANACTIDRELLLPEKHAALLLAKAVADVWDRQCGRVFESMGNENPRAEAIALAITDLRTALDKLR